MNVRWKITRTQGIKIRSQDLLNWDFLIILDCSLGVVAIETWISTENPFTTSHKVTLSSHLIHPSDAPNSIQHPPKKEKSAQAMFPLKRPNEKT